MNERDRTAPLPRPEKKELLRPRRVRGGVRFSNDDKGRVDGSWAAQRWTRLVEHLAPSEALVEGLEYARLGQTRRVEFVEEGVRADIQGRAHRAYKVRMRLRPFSEQEWDRVVSTMIEQAVYAAKLLSGELPTNIEDIFAPLDLHLFPLADEDFELSCSCSIEHRWCKHQVCLAWHTALKLVSDPFLIFALRGVEASDLTERLRQRRQVAGVRHGTVPVYASHVPGLTDFTDADPDPARFWDASGWDDADCPIEAPEVSHPLLRRLGSSPFEGRFPLVGLLATCYEVISEAAIQESEVASADEPE
ncbi:MAG: hypothetical protein KDA28_04550 [Phycisphaerales bacterium]|nr:hypothetical protein [Phycisphaerales bacterium]